jgi:hypothetical protein
MNDLEKAIEEAKADLLPFESWERLTNETPLAYSAFCAFRDLGAERNIRKAVENVEKDLTAKARNTRYGVIGLFNSVGVIGRLIMTVILKNLNKRN